jgi:nucleotide-binding universal stress UspA family protein
MFKKILIPLDGSLLAEQAIPSALALAKAFNAELFLIQIVTNYLVPPYGVDYHIGETFRDTALREASEYLENVQTRIETEFAGAVNLTVLEGLVAENILDFAETSAIDVVVMATHGRSGVGRWVFGSVAERVLRAATCPVLLVRADEKKLEKVWHSQHKTTQN